MRLGWLIMWTLQWAMIAYIYVQFMRRGRELIARLRELRDAKNVIWQCRKVLSEKRDFESYAALEQIRMFHAEHGGIK